MDVAGRRRSTVTRSPPRTSVDAPIVVPGGPQSVLTAGPWGSSTFAPSATSGPSLEAPAVAMSAGHILTPPSFRPHRTMYVSSESVLSTTGSSSCMTSDRSTDGCAIRRISAYDPSLHNVPEQDQQRSYTQQPHKRRRPCYSTESPPHESISPTVTRSTSWNEFSTNVFDSSSSLTSSLQRHRHPYDQQRQSYRPLSFPYGTSATSAVASPFLLQPLSVELPPVRSAVGPVVGCFGAVRPPAYEYPVQRVDAHLSSRPVDVFYEAEVERHRQQRQRQRLSMCGTDELALFTAVTHQCMSHGTSTCSSAAGGGGGYQLSQGNSSLISYYVMVERITSDKGRYPTAQLICVFVMLDLDF